MIKKSGFYICMGIIILLCIYSIYLMYKTDANYMISIEEEYISHNSGDSEIYTVELGSVEKVLSVDGTVMPVCEEEKIEVLVEGKLSEIKKNIQRGDILEKDTVYASCRGKEYKVAGKMQCVEIKDAENGVVFEFIEYGKLYIEAKISEEYTTGLMKEQEVTLEHNGDRFTGNIVFVDGYCMEGKVKTDISYKNEEVLLRPGSLCKVSIQVAQKENVVAVPLEYIVYVENEDEYRIMIDDGGKSMSIPVEVGLIGDDKAEIISGIKENDVIVMPLDEISLRYFLNNRGDKE